MLRSLTRDKKSARVQIRATAAPIPSWLVSQPLYDNNADHGDYCRCNDCK